MLCRGQGRASRAATDDLDPAAGRRAGRRGVPRRPAAHAGDPRRRARSSARARRVRHHARRRSPYFVEERLDWDPREPGDPEIGARAARALDAIGVGLGACHTEYVVTGEGPRIIEVNYRVIGDNCDFLLADLLGVPLHEWILRVHAGEPAPQPPAAARPARRRACSVVADREGTVTAGARPEGELAGRGAAVAPAAARGGRRIRLDPHQPRLPRRDPGGRPGPGRGGRRHRALPRRSTRGWCDDRGRRRAPLPGREAYLAAPGARRAAARGLRRPRRAGVPGPDRRRAHPALGAAGTARARAACSRTSPSDPDERARAGGGAGSAGGGRRPGGRARGGGVRRGVPRRRCARSRLHDRHRDGCSPGSRAAGGSSCRVRQPRRVRRPPGLPDRALPARALRGRAARVRAGVRARRSRCAGRRCRASGWCAARAGPRPSRGGRRSATSGLPERARRRRTCSSRSTRSPSATVRRDRRGGRGATPYLPVRPTLSMRTVEVARRGPAGPPEAAAGHQHARAAQPPVDQAGHAARRGRAPSCCCARSLARERLPVELADEQAYAHAGHEYLGWLLRAATRPGEIVPVAALPAPAPGRGRVIDELARRYHGGDATALLRDYLHRAARLERAAVRPVRRRAGGAPAEPRRWCSATARCACWSRTTTACSPPRTRSPRRASPVPEFARRAHAHRRPARARRRVRHHHPAPRRGGRSRSARCRRAAGRALVREALADALDEYGERPDGPAAAGPHARRGPAGRQVDGHRGHARRQGAHRRAGREQVLRHERPQLPAPPTGRARLHR